MKKKIIIAISGKKGSGKSTFAAELALKLIAEDITSICSFA